MKHDLSVARALTWRYVIALSLVAALSTAAWFSLHQVISAQKHTSAVVNISGRQRMLSQRTALFANLLIIAPKAERPAIRVKLNESIALMAHSHQSLIHGDKAMGLPDSLSPAVYALYFNGENPLDAQVASYIKTVRRLLAEEDEALTPDNPLLGDISQTSSTTLVAQLDKMVSQYQLEGEAAVASVQRVETTLWLLTLLLLAAEARLIFYPFTQHVRSVITRLRDAMDELKLHKVELESRVEQRTKELETRTLSLVESEEKFRLISTAAHDAIIIVGTEEQIIYWNPAAEKMFGYTADEVIGKNLHDFLPTVDQSAAAHRGFKNFQYSGDGPLVGKTIEVNALRKNGEEFPIALSISAFKFQGGWHAMGIIRDITERKQMEEQVKQLAFYDALTNLPNRRLLGDRLEQTMATSRRSGRYSALMFLDMDNFKPLNDTYGHVAGDALLVEAASRLKNCMREMDTVARFGGDEFVVMLTELSEDKKRSASEARKVAEKIRASLAEPYVLSIHHEGEADTGVVHYCSASIGVALFVNHDASSEDLLKWADAAMYQAKASGRNQIQFYDEKSSLNI